MGSRARADILAANPWHQDAGPYAAWVAAREAAALDGHLPVAPPVEFLGDVEGQEVLDAGCGEGFLARIVVARGASVNTIDVSPRLVELARRRDPDGRINYVVADLSEPLPELAHRFDQPQGYMGGPSGLQVANIPAKLPQMTSPGGGVLCSIADLARFALAHVDGLRGRSRLLRSETFRRLHTPPSGAGMQPYACGWEQVTGLTPQPLQGHGGSNGTFRCFIGLFPERGEAIVAAVNDGGEERLQPTQQAIRAMVTRETARRAPKRSGT